MPNMADVFDSVHNVESQLINQGYQEGCKHGLTAGLKEGRELGVQKGYELGLELGYYAGCVRLLRKMQQLDSSLVPERAHKVLSAVEELLATYPLYNPEDVRLQDVLEQLQSKFKVLAALLGKTQTYFPRNAFGPLYKY